MNSITNFEDVGIGHEEEQWAQLIKEIDTDGDGKISKEEFTQALTNFISKTTKGIITKKTMKGSDYDSDDS